MAEVNVSRATAHLHRLGHHHESAHERSRRAGAARPPQPTPGTEVAALITDARAVSDGR